MTIADTLPKYRSHKVVSAAPILDVSGTLLTLEVVGGTRSVAVEPKMFARYTPVPRDYYVVYEDGYASISPRAAFEEGYHPVIDAADKTDTGDFGWAIKALRAGHRLERAGWNGKGMFLFLVPGSRFIINRPPLLGIYAEGTEIDYHAHIDMKTAQGYVVPWLASQADMLALDWKITEGAGA